MVFLNLATKVQLDSPENKFLTRLAACKCFNHRYSEKREKNGNENLKIIYVRAQTCNENITNDYEIFDNVENENGDKKLTTDTQTLLSVIEFCPHCTSAR